jgi:tetratricopeptide (TPR) repeat protein
MRFSRGNLLYNATFRGRWDEMLENADRFIAECETSPHNMETAARELRAYVRFARADVDGALEDWEHALALSREMGDPTRLLPALLQLARGLTFLGRVADAGPLVSEGMQIAEANPTIGHFFSIVAGLAGPLGVPQEVVEIVSRAPAGVWKDAALAKLGDEPTRAAEIYQWIGAPVLAADARFTAAEALLQKGHTAEGLAELDEALAFYRSVRATFFLERGEALLAAAQRDSA